MPEPRRLLSHALLALSWAGLFLTVLLLPPVDPAVYNISLYAQVPAWAWIGLCSAFIVGASVSLLGPRSDRAASRSALLLAYGCYISILALPALLGYTGWGRAVTLWGFEAHPADRGCDSRLRPSEGGGG